MKPKALIGLIAGGIIIYSGLWYSMGLNAERQIIEQLNHLRESGATIHHSPPELTGFPYRLEITLKDVDIKANNFNWQAKATSATAIGHVWSPDHWFLRLNRSTVMVLDGAVSISSYDTLSSIRWGDDRTMHIGIDLSSSKVGGGILSTQGIEAEKAELHLIIPPTDHESNKSLLSPLVFKGALRVAKTSGQNAKYPALDRGEILFALHGAGLNAWSKHSLGQWRDTGGTLEITAASIHWGKSELDGNASLSLDEALRPLGAATLTLKNAAPMLRNLKKLGLLSDKPNQNNGIISVMAQSGKLTANGKVIAHLKAIKP